jgi:hypothetical protein
VGPDTLVDSRASRTFKPQLEYEGFAPLIMEIRAKTLISACFMVSLFRLYQNTRHARSIGGFFSTWAILDYDTIAWVDF